MVTPKKAFEVTKQVLKIKNVRTSKMSTGEKSKEIMSKIGIQRTR